MKTAHEFYVATAENEKYLIYSSETFKLTEIEFLNLIKICYVEARSKSIGKRLIAIYKDNKGKLAKDKLKLIGVTDNGSTEPVKQHKPSVR